MACSCGYDHAQIRAACKSSLFFTARFLCNFEDVSVGYHKKLADIVDVYVSSGERRIGIFQPRGHLKTHVFTIADTIKDLINDRNSRTLIMQGSAKKAGEILRTIKAILVSDRLRHFFPEIIQAEPWNENDATIIRDKNLPDASVSVRGVDSKVTGGHFDKIKFDDLIGEDNYISDAEMERCLRLLRNVNPLFHNPSIGILFVIGTRWPNDKMYKYVLEKQHYKFILSGCYVDERSEWLGIGKIGDAIWPERYNLETLQVIRDENEEFEFSYQYLNLPVSDALRRFKESYIQPFVWEKPWSQIRYRKPGDDRDTLVNVKDLYRVLTVDPAASGEAGADETAVEISGKTSDNTVFILEDYGDRINVNTLANLIIDMKFKWNPHMVGVERGAFEIMLRPYLQQEMLRRNIHFSVVPLIAEQRNKTRRIDSLQPFFANLQVYIAPGCERLISQILGFSPTGLHDTGLKHDDRIDALAFHTKWWRESSPDPAEDSEYIKSEEDVEKGIRLYGLECTT